MIFHHDRTQPFCLLFEQLFRLVDIIHFLYTPNTQRMSRIYCAFRRGMQRTWWHNAIELFLFSSSSLISRILKWSKWAPNRGRKRIQWKENANIPWLRILVGRVCRWTAFLLCDCDSVFRGLSDRPASCSKYCTLYFHEHLWRYSNWSWLFTRTILVFIAQCYHMLESVNC